MDIKVIKATETTSDCATQTSNRDNFQSLTRMLESKIL